MEYLAQGYVTATAYHYARAEIWVNGKVDADGSNKWGYDKVSATSSYGYIAGTAKIFYGN